MGALFITFEGPDGSGKSTHLGRAGAWLEELGLPVVCTKEPGGTPVGEAIRGIFLDPCWGELDGRVEALLVFASRRQHLVELIEPALDEGRHVICDRFTDSSLVYQGVGRDLGREWIESLDALATGGRRPDYTLLFDLTPEAAFARGRSKKRRSRGDVDRIDAEGLDFYRAVRGAYLDLARRDAERFRRIDSGGDVGKTWTQVRRVLAELLGVPP
jgi:dTMP kinase